MDTRKYFEAIRDGSFDGRALDSNRISVYALMDVYDNQVVEVLYEKAEEFEKLALTESWTPGKFRQRRLGESDVFKKFLGALKLHKCICTKLQYLKPEPLSQEDSNIIKRINYSNNNVGKYEYEYECECINCQKKFEVLCHLDGMGYDDFQWHEKN